MKITDANGVEGFLIWTPDGIYFRVYHGNFDFTDYKFLHDDLEVRIIDTTASLYEIDNGNHTLDYSPNVLGRE